MITLSLWSLSPVLESVEVCCRCIEILSESVAEFLLLSRLNRILMSQNRVSDGHSPRKQSMLTAEEEGSERAEAERESEFVPLYLFLLLSSSLYPPPIFPSLFFSFSLPSLLWVCRCVKRLPIVSNVSVSRTLLAY